MEVNMEDKKEWIEFTIDEESYAVLKEIAFKYKMTANILAKKVVTNFLEVWEKK